MQGLPPAHSSSPRATHRAPAGLGQRMSKWALPQHVAGGGEAACRRHEEPPLAGRLLHRQLRPGAAHEARKVCDCCPLLLLVLVLRMHAIDRLGAAPCCLHAALQLLHQSLSLGRVAARSTLLSQKLEGAAGVAQSLAQGAGGTAAAAAASASQVPQQARSAVQGFRVAGVQRCRCGGIAERRLQRRRLQLGQAKSSVGIQAGSQAGAAAVASGCFVAVANSL